MILRRTLLIAQVKFFGSSWVCVSSEWLKPHLLHGRRKMQLMKQAPGAQEQHLAFCCSRVTVLWAPRSLSVSSWQPQSIWGKPGAFVFCLENNTSCWTLCGLWHFLHSFVLFLSARYMLLRKETEGARRQCDSRKWGGRGDTTCTPPGNWLATTDHTKDGSYGNTFILQQCTQTFWSTIYSKKKGETIWQIQGPWQVCQDSISKTCQVSEAPCPLAGSWWHFPGALWGLWPGKRMELRGEEKQQAVWPWMHVTSSRNQCFYWKYTKEPFLLSFALYVSAYNSLQCCISGRQKKAVDALHYRRISLLFYRSLTPFGQ